MVDRGDFGVSEKVHESEHGWCQDHDEDGGEDEQEGGEHDLDRRLLGHLTRLAP